MILVIYEKHPSTARPNDLSTAGCQLDVQTAEVHYHICVVESQDISGIGISRKTSSDTQTKARVKDVVTGVADG